MCKRTPLQLLPHSPPFLFLSSHSTFRSGQSMEGPSVRCIDFPSKPNTFTVTMQVTYVCFCVRAAQEQGQTAGRGVCMDMHVKACRRISLLTGSRERNMPGQDGGRKAIKETGMRSIGSFQSRITFVFGTRGPWASGAWIRTRFNDRDRRKTVGIHLFPITNTKSHSVTTRAGAGTCAACVIQPPQSCIFAPLILLSRKKGSVLLRRTAMKTC